MRPDLGKTFGPFLQYASWDSTDASKKKHHKKLQGFNRKSSRIPSGILACLAIVIFSSYTPQKQVEKYDDL